MTSSSSRPPSKRSSRPRASAWRGVETRVVPRHASMPIGPARVRPPVLVRFAGGYLVAYLYRAVNVVVAPDLVGEFGLSASALGLVAAAYPFTYAAGQLPV